MTHAGAEHVLARRFRIDAVVRETAVRVHSVGVDVASGAPVAIESAPAIAVPAVTPMRLDHARAAVGERPPPMIAAVRGSGVEDGAVHLVTDLPEGMSLRELRGERMPVAEAVAVGADVLAALAHLHARGVLHRDVTPAAVTLSRGGPVRAVLTAVGLAPDVGLLGSVADVAAEEVEHLAPEAAGALPGGVDERSDLYAAGVLVYLLVAGRPPVVADTAAELLRAAVAAPPPPLRVAAPHAPRALEDVLARMLARDPRDRYQTALAAAADMRALGAALAGGEREPQILIGAEDLRTTLAEPAFVGRRAELSALEGHAARAREGRGGLVLLDAPSGGGKTRLLDELAIAGGDAGMWVLRGGGVDHAATHPFQLVDTVVREVVREAGRRPALLDAVREGLSDGAAAACAAMPDLAALVGPLDDRGLGPEEHAEERSLTALSRLLDALGADRPALVVLDDAQWADDLSLRLLARWSQRPPLGERPVLVVAAFRSEEAGPGHPLRALPALDRVALPPLGPDEIGGLATTMAGALPAEALEAVGRMSGGNPFMATAALRGLVESAALRPHREGWSLTEGALEEVGSSAAAADVLVRRMDLLPGGALALLTAGAVLGRHFDAQLAAELAGLDPAGAGAALAEARRRHIVWSGADERVSFAHDKLREALLARALPDEIAALHRAAARSIERRDPALSFDLAYHYSAGGEPRRALPHALRAAAAARGRHALGAAERHLRIALAAAEGLDAPTRRDIDEGLGDVLMLAGRYEEAQEHLERARDLAADPVSRAGIDGRLGELAFKRGDIETACAAYERALRLLGHRVPRSPVALAAAAAREVAVQAAHTALSARLVGRRPAPPADAPEMLAVRLHSRVAYPYWFGRGAVPTLWAHLRGMNLAERYEPTAELAQAWSEHAPVMTVLPWFSRAIAYAERSLAVRRDLGDVWGQGQSLHFYGVALYGASRFRECIARCEDALRLLEPTGDRWEMNTAAWHIAICDLRLGNLAAAAERAREVHRQGREIGDAQAAGISLGIWARATGGDVPAELIAAELARGGEDVHTRSELVMAEALRLMRAGRPGAAARVLHQQQRAIERRGFRQEYVAPVSAWLATALRMRLEQTTLSRARRVVVARRARRAARRATWWARGYRNNLPHALREQALILALTGSGRRSAALLARSAAEAERQGAAYELALTRRAQARLAAEAGTPDAAAALRRADERLRLLRGEDAVDPRAPAMLSLADRFDAVLVAGRRIASALTPEDVRQAVGQAALGLLRAERAEVADLPSPDGAAVAAGPVVDEPPGGGSRLRVAILADGRAAALLTVEHSGLSGLFGPEEERLAEYVATLAGAALENAATAARLEHSALHDALTGLPNRELARERIDLAIKRAARTGGPLSVLLLDLDDFKNVNDSLGHAAGDRLLGDAADRLRELVRPMDTPARLGGDEFAVLVEDADVATAELVAARVLEGFGRPFEVEGREVFVSASIGIAVADGDGPAADALLRDADAAMYAAKARGKGAYAVFRPEMRRAAVARLELGTSLRRAVEQDELELHYQPILELGTGAVVAIEALVRWRHPQLGLMGPVEFVPLAEQSGLIGAIGSWVLRRACADLAVVRPSAPGLCVSVNLSPRQLRDRELATTVEEALRSAALPSRALILEITESAIAGDTPGGLAMLRALRRGGVRVAVDDFGAGYSSLGQLRRLPVDLLKVDRAFLADAGTAEAASFLRAIVDLAAGIGVGVVAEGIERPDQLELAVRAGCVHGQGWLWAPAMPLEELRGWLDEEPSAIS